MADLVFVAATLAFFALCVLYVNWCDRIIGGDNFTPEQSRENSSEATTVSSTNQEKTEVSV